MFCDDLEEWDGGGKAGSFQWKQIYVYIELIHVVVQQKLAQQCKVVILQLKVKFKKIP